MIKILYNLLVLLSFSFFLISCKSKKSEESNAAATKKPVIAVEAYVVSPRQITETVQAAGTLLPYESTELHPEVQGRIVGLYINEGKLVAQGTLLVKLYDADLQAQLKKLQVQLAMNQKTVERMTALAKINGISQQELDLNVLQVNNTKADIDIIKTSIAKTEIRAPFNGKIGLKNVSPGAYITPQTIIATIRQEDKLKLEFTVPEKYAPNMQVGNTIPFMVTGSKKTMLSTIIATETSIDHDTRTLKVRALVTEKNNALISGAFAQVMMDFENNKNPILVPSQAIIPLARSKQVVLYKNGKSKFVTVKTIARDSSFVQIEDSVQIGDTIITTGLLSLKHNASITLSKINQTTK